MKKGINYVPAADVLSVVQESGLSCLAQKGFVKVSGAKGRNVYIAKTRRVGRVDISGFEYEGDGVRTLDADEAFGSVTQQLDFSRDPEETLATLREVLEHMKTLPEREVKRGTRNAGPDPFAEIPQAPARNRNAEAEQAAAAE